jgi:nucleoside-diphosphate-sugar epimerase
MNILVVGGCGFIGSNLAKKLSIRKHMVSVIDIKEPRSINLLRDGIKYYNLDAGSENCAEVFDAEYFETVIYAAGSAFGKTDIDCGQEFSTLINILNLCVEFNVKNFIYISTAYLNTYKSVLDTQKELDIYCANKMIGEYYCSLYNKFYNLNCSIIRLPIVYGPGQDVFGEGGIVLKLLKSSIEKEYSKIFMYGTILEFSYINDVSERLYNFINNGELGVYAYIGVRIKSDILFSRIEMLAGKNNFDIVYTDGIDMTPSDEIKLLNKPEENTIIDIGLHRTLEWFLEQKASELKEKIENHQLPSSEKNTAMIFENKPFSYLYKNIINSLKMLLPWGESIFLCALSVWISDKTKLLIDPRLICIMIIGLMYGTKYSITAAFLCFIFSVKQFIDITKINVLEIIIAYLFTALISGFSISSKNIENKSLKESYSRLEQLHLRIKKDFSENKKEAYIMAEQIRTTENNFVKIPDIIRELIDFNTDKILARIPEIVFELTGFKYVELYMDADGENRFDFLCSLYPEYNIYKAKKSYDFTDKNEIIEILHIGNVYIKTHQDVNIPDAIIPLLNYNIGKIAGIIAIKHISFIKFNLKTECMLKFIGELLSSCFSNSVKR